MANPKKAYIINLSTLHKLYPITTTGFMAFADLYQYYYPYHFLSYLTYPIDLTRVGLIYYKNQHIINGYKLGQITTEEFERKMLQAFNFLQNREDARNLLIKAWNKIIDFDSEHDARVKALYEKAKDEGAEIFIVSNTNEIHIQKILDHLHTNAEIDWTSAPDISCQKNTTPTVLAEGVFLCFSYRYAEFKSPELEQTLPTGTPSLLGHVTTDLEQNGYQKDNILVISQHDGDIKAAGKLGIHAEKDEKFFASFSLGQQARPN